jgi:hypothetical protein
VANPSQTDCDADGIGDACALASGAVDADGDGRPDLCEMLRGDLDLDGVVGGLDLAELLGRWGEKLPYVGDLDGDGLVGGGDLTVLLANWGKLSD